MQTWEKGLLVVSVIAGLYFLVFHQDPLPLNHESIGLGTLHVVHDVIGIVLIGTAGFLWWRSGRCERTPSGT
ncbi:MAG TPA: hypothetical protein VEM77_06160 [Thermoplasmata archaeon]|nr:hypothetical protein [Thermoplasmata archaeon]